MKTTLRVDVWSDTACPWCYVGKRRFEAALKLFPHRDSVELVWRAFELDPSAPATRADKLSQAQRVAAKYGMPVSEAQVMINRLVEVGRADGLDFQMDKNQSGNTFDAHRVLHLALERGVQDAVKERLFRAYFTEGAALGDRKTLATLATEAGLDRDEVETVLESDRYAREVREDERTARELGISGVPFFVVDGRYGVSGAQPAPALLEVLNKAWDEAASTQATQADATTCGPDGCA